MMIELLTNMITWTALGGSLVIVAIVTVKTIISLAARASVPSPLVESKERRCAYCGMILGEEHKCKNCGAVERNDRQ